MMWACTTDQSLGIAKLLASHGGELEYASLQTVRHAFPASHYVVCVVSAMLSVANSRWMLVILSAMSYSDITGNSN